jgi:hypothetical protein
MLPCYKYGAGFSYRQKAELDSQNSNSQVETVLNRPILRQVAANFFVFRIVGRSLSQALERFEHLLLVHLQSIGDHTRGLFEADASIAVSTAHALKDVKIFFASFAWHKLTLPNS